MDCMKRFYAGHIPIHRDIIGAAVRDGMRSGTRLIILLQYTKESVKRVCRPGSDVEKR